MLNFRKYVVKNFYKMDISNIIGPILPLEVVTNQLCQTGRETHTKLPISSRRFLNFFYKIGNVSYSKEILYV